MPWILAKGQLVFSTLMGLGFGVTVAIVIVVMAKQSTISSSIWEPSTNAIPWFVAFMAGYTFYQVVPMMIANGRTRRNATIEALQVNAATALLATVFTTLGFLVEWGVYRWQRWPESIHGDHFFTRYNQVGTIFWETLLTMLFWSAMGAFLGAAFYRDNHKGWLMLIPAAILNALVSVFLTTRAPFFNLYLHDALADWNRNLILATVVVVAGVGISIGVLWSILRDMPLRPWR